MVPLWSHHSRCCAAALPRAAVGPRNAGRNGCGLQGLAGGTAHRGSTAGRLSRSPGFPEASKVVPPSDVNMFVGLSSHENYRYITSNPQLIGDNQLQFHYGL